MKIPFFLLRAHAKKTWLRTILTVSSVFIAVLIFGMLRTFIVGLESTLSQASPSRLVTGSAISLFAQLPKRLESELAKVPHVQATCHWTWFGGIYKDESPDHIWSRFGVEVEGFRAVYASDMDLSDEAWKAFAENRTACIVGEGLVRKESFKMGDTIPILGNIYPGTVELQVVGIYKSKTKSFDETTLFFHWDYMNELAKQNGGRGDLVSTFSLLLDDPSNAGKVSAIIDSEYESSDHRTRTLTERAFQTQFSSMWGNLPLFFTILGTIVLIACLMVTANTMMLNARERVQEVGILKTLGFTRGSITTMTLLEGILLCLIGGAMAMGLLRSLDGSAALWVPMVVPMRTVLEGMTIALVLGVVSGLVPALMTGRMKIVDSLRMRA